MYITLFFCRELSSAVAGATAAAAADIDKDGEEIASECGEQSSPLTTDDNILGRQADNADNAGDTRVDAAGTGDNSDKTDAAAADKDNEDVGDGVFVVKFSVDDDEPVCDKPSDESSSDGRKLIDARLLQQQPATSHSQLFILLRRTNHCFMHRYKRR